jgi:hypothetical protein
MGWDLGVSMSSTPNCSLADQFRALTAHLPLESLDTMIRSEDYKQLVRVVLYSILQIMWWLAERSLDHQLAEERQRMIG